jgi:DNA modification methylase
MSGITLYPGDCREVLKRLPAASVHCCLTSPPYYGLRSYLPGGHPDKPKEIGLEPTPDDYVAQMVAVFREVRRVLRDDGTLWLNLGDCYSGSANSGGANRNSGGHAVRIAGLTLKPGKPKDLLGIPWSVAFALRDDGWWLRSAIVWHKPNPMPESVRDRPTSAYEHVFLLAKGERYFYDAEAIRQEPTGRTDPIRSFGHVPDRSDRDNTNGYQLDALKGANARNVWTIATEPFRDAHFACMPPELAERCIKAGTSERGCCPLCGAPWWRIVAIETRPNAPSLQGKYNGNNRHRTISGGVGNDSRRRDERGWQASCSCPPHQPIPCTVLDPFAGAGTTGLVADRLQRRAILIELFPKFTDMAERRVVRDAPLLAQVRQVEPARV